MTNTLILYSTFDGQTLLIARRIAAGLQKAGHAVKLVAATSREAGRAIERSDAVVVGGAIHYGRFAKVLASLVWGHAAQLAARPNAFFSVSLSAVRDPKAARACMREFQEKTGWHANDIAVFGGALRYRQYTTLKRLLVQIAARANGEQTDTSRDYEYTDWAAVDRFAASFAAKVAPRAAA